MYNNKIRKYRQEKNMTLDELAERVGISSGYLCHLEKGTRKNPSTRSYGKNCKNIRKKYRRNIF